MRDEKGRFIKGLRSSPDTEFKKGQHWRPKKDHWDKDWLYREYVVNERSASDIAEQQGCTGEAIYYWMDKHGIPRRSMSEARAIKYWGSPGELNGMYGIRGKDNANWKGGSTPERQALYSSIEWGECSQEVWARDRGICQRCGTKVGGGAEVGHIHHIVSFVVKELRTDVNNLILLCRPCHLWVHSNANTEKEYIKEVINDD